MKKLYLLTLLLSIFMHVFSQDMQYSQFYASPLYVNPAFTGATLEHRLTANYRLQWPSIPGGFKSYHFSYDYNASDMNSGFGIVANREESGSFGLMTNLIGLTYSYRFQIKRESYLMLGAKFAYGFRSLDFSKLVFNDQLESGAATTGEQGDFMRNNVSYPDISFGMLFFSPKYWFGISGNHLNKPNQSLLQGGKVSELPIKVSLHGGYVFPLEGGVVQRLGKKNITAAFQYKAQGKFDQFDLGFYYNHEPLVFGVWYRGIPIFKNYEDVFANNDALVALVGYKISDYNFSIGYSYDITISRLISNTAGSHEISLMYEVASKRKKRRNRKFLIPCAKF